MSICEVLEVSSFWKPKLAGGLEGRHRLRFETGFPPGKKETWQTKCFRDVIMVKQNISSRVNVQPYPRAVFFLWAKITKTTNLVKLGKQRSPRPSFNSAYHCRVHFQPKRIRHCFFLLHYILKYLTNQSEKKSSKLAELPITNYRPVRIAESPLRKPSSDYDLRPLVAPKKTVRKSRSIFCPQLPSGVLRIFQRPKRTSYAWAANWVLLSFEMFFLYINMVHPYPCNTIYLKQMNMFEISCVKQIEVGI